MIPFANVKESLGIQDLCASYQPDYQTTFVGAHRIGRMKHGRDTSIGKHMRM